MTDPDDTPMIVNPSAVPDATGTVVRDVLVALAAFPILVRLVGARDLTGLLQWLQSADGAAFLAIVVPVVVTAWRAWLSTQKKRALVRAARGAPDSIAIVKEPAS